VKYLRKLIEPAHSNQDEMQMLPSKLLSRILIGQLLLLVAIAIFGQVVFRHEIDLVFGVRIFTIALLALLYSFSRRGYVQETSIAGIAVISGVIVVEVYFIPGPDRLEPLLYLPLVLLLGAFFLPFRANFLIAVVHLAAIGWLAWVLPDVSWAEVILLPLRLYITMSIVVLLTAWQRDRMELLRQKIWNQNEQRLHRISDQLPGVVYQCEQRADGTISFTYVSDGFYKLYHTSPEEALHDASSIFNLLHPDDKAHFWESLDESIRTMNRWRCEYRLLFPDGTTRWLLDTAMPTRQLDGSILWHGFASDVTEQRSIEHQNQLNSHRLQAILQAIPDLLFELDEEGSIRDYLSRPTPLLIVPPEQFIGRHVAEFLPAEAVKIIMAAITHAAEHGEATGIHYQLTTPAGLRWRELTLARMAAGPDGLMRFVALERDVTDRKQAEQRLYQQNQYLATMHQITLELLNRRDMAELLQAAVEQAAALLDAPYSELLLKDRDGDEEILVTSASTAQLFFMRGDRVRRGEALLSWQAHDTGEPAILEDYSSWAHSRNIYSPVQLRAVADIPIMAGQECLGILALARSEPDYPFSSEQIRQGILLAQLVALVLDNANLYDAALRELSDRRQAEEALRASETRFRALFDHSPDGILLLDPNVPDGQGKIIDCNEAACRMNGYSRDELIGQSMQLLSSRSYLADLEQLRLDGIFTCEVNHRRKDGSYLPVSVSARLININGRELEISIHRDVTRDVLTREQLQQARDSAEAATKAKSAFLASMSHEIRTPMNGVIGMADLLLESELTPAQREYVEIVKNSGAHLLTIINDILDFSKIEANKVMLAEVDFDLSAILEETVDSLALTAGQKGVELVCLVEPATPTHLRGDPGRLRQVFMNLIGNAVKFTAEGEVIVTVSTLASDDATATLRFEVKDTGIGISAHQQSNLFQAFSQLDGSITRQYGGTGLGLAISKELVTRMGGEIGVTSELGVGSSFWFTVVLSKQRVSPEAETAALPALQGRRILLVTDNATSRRYLAACLTAWRCLYTEAEDTKTAISLLTNAQAQGWPFDLILVDLKASNSGSQSLTQALASNAAFAGIPLILLRAFRQSAPDLDELLPPYVHIITRPIRQSRLYRSLITLLGSSTPEKRLQPPQPVGKALFTNGRTYRILLVDDNIVNQKVGLTLLKKLGFSVGSVADGEEAIAALVASHYDLVLMDVQMPTMDGYTATQMIRQPGSQVQNPAIPIVAMTANALEGDRERCLAAGMNDYVSKPIQVQELKTVLARWLPTH
jgi:PAS domain S-box-containing protein